MSRNGSRGEHLRAPFVQRCAANDGAVTRASDIAEGTVNNGILLTQAKAVGLTAAITVLLKRTVREPRPNGGDRASFPSGHTSAAFALATVMAKGQPRLAWLWYLRAATIGWSRVDLRAHHTHDVIAGAILGHFVASAVMKHCNHHDDLSQVSVFYKEW
jgi:membrane-associated phospholipid phosphatase